MRKVSGIKIKEFVEHLKNSELSKATVEKYNRDMICFFKFAGDQNIDKALCLEYKEYLKSNYAINSANSMIASLNSFLKFMGWLDLCIKQFKIQRRVFCSEETELSKGEYERLVRVAKSKGKERINLVLQTICGTGIRVSELKFITVESVLSGEAEVSCKGKNRVVFIVSKLRKLLIKYAKEHHITSGPIFITRTGKVFDRSNIWREMKQLCKDAGVSEKKVFPHNLRHLFARIFYGIEKDIAKLADVLGHSNINTTRIYIISTGAEHKRRMENMRLII